MSLGAAVTPERPATPASSPNCQVRMFLEEMFAKWEKLSTEGKGSGESFVQWHSITVVWMEAWVSITGRLDDFYKRSEEVERCTKNTSNGLFIWNLKKKYFLPSITLHRFFWTSYQCLWSFLFHCCREQMPSDVFPWTLCRCVDVPVTLLDSDNKSFNTPL